MADLLFHKFELRNALEHQKEKLKHEVEGFQNDYLLTVSEDDVQRFLQEKYEIEAPTLYPDQVTSNGAQDVDIDVSRDPMRMIMDRSRPFYLKGTMVTLRVPFTGERDLFYAQPSTFTMNPPRAEVADGHISFSFRQINPDPAKLKTEYERELQSVQAYLDRIRNDVKAFNDSLSGFIKQLVAQRKDKLLKDRNLEAALGIPLKRASTPPSVPVVKRKPPIRPIPKTTSFMPEPTVPDEEYDHILRVIENMVLVMERSPHAFTKMDEESLRDHILVQLNGHYEGQATGETFNFTGKTDLLIRADGKNAFVGECKFWSGPKNFLETIDQLLGYTSFRDTKTALIIFNKN